MIERTINRHFTRQIETITYTAPWGMDGSPVIDALFCNTDVENREVRVYEVPAGQQPTEAHIVLDWTGDAALKPKETRPARWKTSMNQGDTLRAVADVHGKVTVGFSIGEHYGLRGISVESVGSKIGSGGHRR